MRRVSDQRTPGSRVTIVAASWPSEQMGDDGPLEAKCPSCKDIAGALLVAAADTVQMGQWIPDREAILKFVMREKILD